MSNVYTYQYHIYIYMVTYIYFHEILTFILSSEILHRRLDDTHLCNGPGAGRLVLRIVMIGEVHGLDMVVAANALQPDTRERQKIKKKKTSVMNFFHPDKMML